MFKHTYKFILSLSHSYTNSRLVSQSVQSLSCVWLFGTPWTAAHQASLSITNSQSLLKLISIESVMPSNHLILCCPLLLLPSIFPTIRVFSNESVLRIWWPKYWSFSFSILSTDKKNWKKEVFSPYSTSRSSEINCGWVVCLSLIVSLWSKECGDENHQTWVTGGGAVIQLPPQHPASYSQLKKWFSKDVTCSWRTGRNGCQVSRNNRCSLHLGRVCSPNEVLVVRGSLWLHVCFWLGSSRNCGGSGVWADCQGGMDCLNLDLSWRCG